MSAIYKPGQGYWTRMMSAIGAGTIAVAAGFWLSQRLEAVQVQGIDSVYLQGVGFASMLLLGGFLVYWLIGRKRRSVEFLIATEGEMRKVNWSTRREVMGSTWVVIGVSVIIALVLLVADIILSQFFKAIGVLQ
ncbi:MAG: preprotein translocase subunit SecE [Planctomycetota bacterium]|jgi:preprotein translocase SecE subunit